jgi:Cd(II)/Pb(II)-responsive transcriptional regulator
MKIGELSRVTNTQIETIRYYEREELLQVAPRSDGNYRIYGDEHAKRLSFIRHCRSLDMALDEIRVLLRFKDSPSENCQEVNSLLDEHIQHVAQRVRELNALGRQLKALRSLCLESKDSGDCGILKGLAQLAPVAAAPDLGAVSHLAGVHPRPRQGERRR